MCLLCMLTICNWRFVCMLNFPVDVTVWGKSSFQYWCWICQLCWQKRSKMLFVWYVKCLEGIESFSTLFPLFCFPITCGQQCRIQFHIFNISAERNTCSGECLPTYSTFQQKETLIYLSTWFFTAETFNLYPNFSTKIMHHMPTMFLSWVIQHVEHALTR